MKMTTARFLNEHTPFEGLKVITRNPIGDSRGFLERVFCSTDLTGWRGNTIAQINRTRTSTAGTLRGLHFQRPPVAEVKYVTCLSGSVYDVALDLRAGSDSFGQHFGIKLSAEAHNALIIPEGFAHGFQTLTDDVEMLYIHSEPFTPEFEGGVNATDPNLEINWPLPVMIQSDRDSKLPNLQELEGIFR